jgi:transcriptional regulator with XRE-family HTH domain
MSDSLGAKIRRARRAAGLTQVQLAQALGVADPVTVSRWERGESVPHRMVTRQLAERFPALRRALGVVAA